MKVREDIHMYLLFNDYFLIVLNYLINISKSE